MTDDSQILLSYTLVENLTKRKGDLKYFLAHPEINRARTWTYEVINQQHEHIKNNFF